MHKIIEINENWRIEIYSNVVSLYQSPEERRVEIKASLQELTGAVETNMKTWRDKETLSDIIMPPNWLDKFRKITWSVKCEKAKEKIINYLKYVQEEKVKTKILNSNLYESLDR